MGKLSNKVALITGGSDGMGFYTAELFVAEGAYVYITGRRKAKLDEAVQKIGKNVTGIEADAASMTDIKKVVAQIQEEKGHLDVLFASAAVWEPGNIGSITEKDYDSMFNINVKGVLFLVQEALTILNDGASIIINGSVSALKGWAGSSVYSATKAAVRSFARCWSVDLKERKMRVNVIQPGATDTPMLKKEASTYPDPEGFYAMVCELTPLGRIAKSEEIAKAVLFLACDDSSYVTGIELNVDGGIAQI